MQGGLLTLMDLAVPSPSSSAAGAPALLERSPPALGPAAVRWEAVPGLSQARCTVRHSTKP